MPALRALGPGEIAQVVAADRAGNVAAAEEVEQAGDVILDGLVHAVLLAGAGPTPMIRHGSDSVRIPIEAGAAGWQESAMDKRNRLVQAYGYLVCLVAVITFLISVANLVNAIIDRGDPLYSDYQSGDRLSSFENFKIDALKATPGESASALDDTTLRSAFEAAQNDVIRTVNHRTRRTIIVSILLLVICAILFATHWRWLRKLSAQEP